MITYEEAREKIAQSLWIVRRVPKTVEGIIARYNALVTESEEEYLIWYAELSKMFKTKTDLFESVKEYLKEDENIILSIEDFNKIDEEVDLSRFDLPSAFHIVCRKARGKRL